jgi:hypothetical protein
MEWLGERWTWAAGAAASALTAWLGRQRVGDIWRSLAEMRRAAILLQSCEIERDYCTDALSRMVTAGKLVDEGQRIGLIRPSKPSPTKRSRSRSG